MTSFAQYNNFQPHDGIRMSASSSSSSTWSSTLIQNAEGLWRQHRVGITFVAVVLSATLCVTLVLLLLKWLEKQRAIKQQQQQQESTIFSTKSSSSSSSSSPAHRPIYKPRNAVGAHQLRPDNDDDDVERGKLLDVDHHLDVSVVAAGESSTTVTAASRCDVRPSSAAGRRNVVVVGQGRRLIRKLTDVVRSSMVRKTTRRDGGAAGGRGGIAEVVAA